MRGYVSEIWGWDQAWQEREFSTHFDPSAVILVHQGSNLVGYCQVEGCADELFVRMLVIHPGHRRLGIGTRLLNAVIASRKVHAKGVVLEVFKINPGAHRLYRRLGFQVESETPVSEVMRLASEHERS